MATSVLNLFFSKLALSKLVLPKPVLPELVIPEFVLPEPVLSKTFFFLQTCPPEICRGPVANLLHIHYPHNQSGD